MHKTKESSSKKLIFTIILNFFITAVQIIGGLISGSLALLSDALHNFGDGMAIVVAYITNRISRKRSNIRKTFGYQRVEIIADLFNSTLLIGICIFLFVEAYQRFNNPQPIKAGLMMIIAGAGLLANFIAVILLHGHKSANLNIKAAYLHLLGDTISSVAVILGGVFIYYFKIYWLDPLITVLLGVYIIWHAYGIVKETFDILIMSAPKNFELRKIKRMIEKIPEINNIHHVHAWQLTDQKIHFECHLDLNEDLPVSRTDQIRKYIEKKLKEKFGILHVTLQFEYNACKNKSIIY